MADNNVPCSTMAQDGVGCSDVGRSSIATLRAHLQGGGCIAYATEAVWGLGCDPSNAAAIRALLTLKRRSVDKGLILIGSEVSHFATVISQLPATTQQRLLDSWQVGQPPTTWIVPHHGLYSPELTGGRANIAIRVSHHPVVVQLCQSFAGALVSTSANVAGLPAARTYVQCYDYFADAVRYAEGEVGAYSNPSRIIDALSLTVIR